MQPSGRWDFLDFRRTSRISDDRRMGLRFLDFLSGRDAIYRFATYDLSQCAVSPAPGIRCLNCDGEMEKAQLYCSEFCSDVADLVRYVKRCELDGRLRKTDIQEAIGLKILHLNGGGYAERARVLSKNLRQAIFERDGGTCQVCGAPATEIDHIDGNSRDPKNLRAICGPCNRQGAFDNSQIADPERQEFIDRLWDDLAERILAQSYLRVCDDAVGWVRDKRWQPLMAEAKRARSRVPDEIDEQIVEMMGLGLKQTEMARDLGLSANAVGKRIKRLRRFTLAGPCP